MAVSSAEEHPDKNEENDADEADGAVLAVEVSRGALLDRGGDFAHAVVAGGFPQNPENRHHAVQDGGDAADKRKDDTVGHAVISWWLRCSQPIFFGNCSLRCSTSRIHAVVCYGFLTTNPPSNRSPG